ncbi:MAG: STAS domain-containing protein [Anaerolineae bacterium]
MSSDKLTMEVRPLGPGISLIEIEGELTGAAEKTLMEAYAQASGSETRTIILNFEKLIYMNSSGIGLLVTLLIRATRQGQRLATVGLSSHYRHIFELTGLDEAIAIYPSEADALAALNLSA